MRRGILSTVLVAIGPLYCSSVLSLRWRGSTGNDTAGGGEFGPFEATSPPPRPAFYVPPEERDAGDASLMFLRRKKQQECDGCSGNGGDGTHFRAEHGVKLGPGQSFAPTLPKRTPSSPNYMDEAAARLESTSVLAGHHLLSREPDAVTTRLRVFKNTADELKEIKISSRTSSCLAGRENSIFDNKNVFDNSEEKKEKTVAWGKKEKCDLENSVEQEKIPLLQQLELDLRRLEYFQGTEQYQKLLEEFRAKYYNDDGGTGSSDSDGCKVDGRIYTREELERGLDAQPIDYLRGSNRLKAELGSGPRAYDPVLVMQRLGVMRFQGYAFPPTTELGKLRDSEGRELEGSGDGCAAKRYARKNSTSVIKSQLDQGQDRHILYLTLGLGAVQRRQARAMFSDFDYSDRQTAFHVMMSYPYTDWVHVFYMVLVGMALYTLQVRCDAYEFYDEYLGLDLRQVPKLKKPFLAAATVLLMIVVFFHPLLLASVATTRLYRIAMKRPIGPP